MIQSLLGIIVPCKTWFTESEETCNETENGSTNYTTEESDKEENYSYGVCDNRRVKRAGKKDEETQS